MTLYCSPVYIRFLYRSMYRAYFYFKLQCSSGRKKNTQALQRTIHSCANWVQSIFSFQERIFFFFFQIFQHGPSSEFMYYSISNLKFQTDKKNTLYCTGLFKEYFNLSLFFFNTRDGMCEVYQQTQQMNSDDNRQYGPPGRVCVMLALFFVKYIIERFIEHQTPIHRNNAYI